MPSIGKIHRILELLRENGRYGLSNKEIAEALDIPPSTCYRILASLRQYDYVTQRRTDMRYFLGFSHLRFAQAVVENSDEAAVAAEYLDELHTLTKETVFYSKYSVNCCVALEVRGAVNTRIAVGQGELMPLYCSAAGKAVMAFLPEKEQEKILRSLRIETYTDATISDLSRLEAELSEIKRSGIAFNRGEFHTGINAMAAPVFDRRGSVTGSITVVGTNSGLTDAVMRQHGEAFLKASMAVTRRIGGKFPQWLSIKGS